MNLNLPVVDTKSLKRSYYYFVAFTLFVAAASIVCDVFAKDLLGRQLNDKIIDWVLIAIGLGTTFYIAGKSNRELKAIRETVNWDEKLSLYERFYKRRLMWNAFSLVLSGAFLISSNSRFFVYFLIFQTLLSLAGYPGKRLLAIDLKTEDFMIT